MDKRARRRRRSGSGWTTHAAALEANIPYKRLRAAIARGEVRVVEFGGTVLLTDDEVQRLKVLYSPATPAE